MDSLSKNVHYAIQRCDRRARKNRGSKLWRCKRLTNRRPTASRRYLYHSRILTAAASEAMPHSAHSLPPDYRHSRLTIVRRGCKT